MTFYLQDIGHRGENYNVFILWNAKIDQGEAIDLKEWLPEFDTYLDSKFVKVYSEEAHTIGLGAQDIKDHLRACACCQPLAGGHMSFWLDDEPAARWREKLKKGPSDPLYNLSDHTSVAAIALGSIGGFLLGFLF